MLAEKDLLYIGTISLDPPQPFCQRVAQFGKKNRENSKIVIITRRPGTKPQTQTNPMHQLPLPQSHAPQTNNQGKSCHEKRNKQSLVEVSFQES
jgi:hypothetical protein